MPNLFSSFSECLGFSQIIKSHVLSVSIALKVMSSKLPIGVATIYIPFSILIINLFILSCTPIKLPKQSQQLEKAERLEVDKVNIVKQHEISSTEDLVKDFEDTDLTKDITVIFSNNNKESFTKQFVNVLELALFNKGLDKVSFDIEYFNDEKELKDIIERSKTKGKIFIGPTEVNHTKIAKSFCDNGIIFFSFSSDTSLADNCIYLINFFPKNELEQLFLYLDEDSRVALLYPENSYGYYINLVIDDALNSSEAILVNRSSYKNDLSNVRDAIKELGKYELRKYELDRQKRLLSSKKDDKSKKRLKRLNKFNTTSDYDFTHVLIADYGLNLLQVAPLLPYYDIDPNVVQFLGTGVIDDENFFLEPSLQGAIFPGIQKTKRLELSTNYQNLYDENLLRISTLPYDLVGLLNYIYSRNLTYKKTLALLNSSNIKFDGVDGKFYFKDNIIERELEILKISNGQAKKIN